MLDGSGRAERAIRTSSSIIPIRLIILLITSLTVGLGMLVLAGERGMLTTTTDQLGGDWYWYRDGIDRLFAGAPLFDVRMLEAPYQQRAPEFQVVWNQWPGLLPLIMPFWLLPDQMQPATWFVFTTALAATALWLVWPRSWWWGSQLAFAAVILPLPFVFNTFHSANLSALAALGVVLAWIGRQRNSTALMTLGLLAAGVSKILPGILLGLFLLLRERRGRPLLGALIIAALLSTPAVVVYGPKVIGDFVIAQLNMLPTISNGNLSPRVVLFVLFGISLPQFIFTVAALLLISLSFWRRLNSGTALLLLLLGMCGLVQNLWLHWFFIPLVAGLLVFRDGELAARVDTRIRRFVTKTVDHAVEPTPAEETRS